MHSFICQKGEWDFGWDRVSKLCFKGCEVLGMGKGGRVESVFLYIS